MPLCFVVKMQSIMTVGFDFLQIMELTSMILEPVLDTLVL